MGLKQGGPSGQRMQGGAEELSTESRKQTGGDEGPLEATTLSVSNCLQLPFQLWCPGEPIASP